MYIITKNHKDCIFNHKNKSTKLLFIFAIIFFVFAQSINSSEIDNSQNTKKERIAILKLQSVGADETMTRSIAESLLTFIGKQEKYEIIERSQLNKVLKEQGLSNTDEFNEETAAKIGYLLGVKIILLGSVSKLGNNIVINVRGIDVNNAMVLFTEIESTKFEDDLINTIERLAIKICKGEEFLNKRKRNNFSFNKTGDNYDKSILKYLFKNKYTIKPLNIVGIIFAPIGSTMLTAGIILTTFFTMFIMSDSLYPENVAFYSTYEEYSWNYNWQISWFSVGITFTVLGVCMSIASFPMMLYNIKDRLKQKYSKLSFQIGFDKDIKLALLYKF